MGDMQPKMYEEKGTTAVQDEYEVQTGDHGELKRDLQGRHMQMIAIGGAIGAGLFVSGGGVLAAGGPGSTIIAFTIIGTMLMLVIQALAELGVMYPVNGAFFEYNNRFVSKAVGFATGWDYAIQWLTVLPFEITAAGLTLQFWQRAREINIGVWITVFLVALCIVQVFGVRGYGETEFVLSLIKILACTGFIILAIIIDCGGVPTDPRGYIGARYWYEPYSNGGFVNGFPGFASVFTTASFAYGGTELVGLAAAEAANPVKAIPKAAKQVTFRIGFFYILMLFLVGLIVPANNPNLLFASSSNTKYSAFVIAITEANIPALPSIFNVVITISVLSVANSCTFGSTRTLQALAARGMAPRFLQFIDKHGRPIYCVLLQLAFGLLAFINEADVGTQVFSWLLSLSGLVNFFVWGCICIAHVRFRKAWKLQGRSLDDLPYKAPLGVWGSYVAIFVNVVCIMAVFYTAVWPVGGTPSAKGFFQNFLAGPLILAFYLGYIAWKREWPLLIPLSKVDLDTGMRLNLDELRQTAVEEQSKISARNLPYRILRLLI